MDTVVFTIPLYDSAKAPLRSLLAKFDGEGNEKSGFYSYFLDNEDFDYLNSGYTPPAFTETPQGMKFQFSLPKLVKGHSVYMATDVRRILSSLEDSIRACNIFPHVPNYEGWIVNRIDFAYNFDLIDQTLVNNAIDQLKLLKYRGKHPNTSKSGKLVAHWNTKQKVIKFYNKLEEMLVHRDDYSPQVLEAAAPVLRFELGLRSEALRRELNLPYKYYSLTFDNVLDRLSSKTLLSQIIWKHINQLTRRGQYLSLTESMARIRKLKKYRQYEDFALKLVDHGPEEVREQFIDDAVSVDAGKRKYRRYASVLSQIGLAPETFQTFTTDDIQPWAGIDSLKKIHATSETNLLNHDNHPFFTLFRSLFHETERSITSIN